MFEAVVDGLREAVGGPWTYLPTEMMIVGEGGVAGTSELCGTLYAAASVIFLATGALPKEERERAFHIVQDLFLWYAQSEIPIYVPKEPIKYKGEIPRSVSGSVLCHVSVSKWCKVSGQKAFSDARKERCGRLAACVAARTVELLNAYHAGTFKPSFFLSAEAQSCRKCHDKGSELENTRGIMECTECHFNLGTEHP